VLFNPVVLENYQDCKQTKPDWLKAAEERALGDPEMTRVVSGLNSYFKQDGRQYAHFVDGGITDNLGLRAIYEIVEVSGGIDTFVRKLDRKPARHLVVLSVNASTDPEPEMDISNKQPSLGETIGAVTDAQLHLYNTATLELMNTSVQRWAKDLATPGAHVSPYFIQLGFRDIKQPERRRFFNQLPTSFSLTDDQVEKLIAAGRQILRDNPDYQRFIADLGGARTTHR
jgi:NTE family protein